jgi:hypothetical protein
VLVAAGLAFGARGLARHTTWYLASDQFAFLTFADDLAAGRVFHDPTEVAWLANPFMPRSAPRDAYFQTYIYRDGRLHSRYPPGFPLLLAATKRTFGEAGAHALNPGLYLVLLAVLAAIASRLVEADLGWAAAATVVWLLLVLPVEVHYWGITVSRDLPAHLLALTALLSLTHGVRAWTGLALGFATSIRPDAALWVPAVQLASPRGPAAPRSLMSSLLGFLAGVAPLLAYNTMTGGHPFAFTQGGEFRHLFNTASMLPAGLLTAALDFTSGGAFQLTHLRATLPEHVRYLASSFGVFLPLAGLGFLLAPSPARPLARGVGLYAGIGLIFYSCWASCASYCWLGPVWSASLPGSRPWSRPPPHAGSVSHSRPSSRLGG